MHFLTSPYDVSNVRSFGFEKRRTPYDIRSSTPKEYKHVFYRSSVLRTNQGPKFEYIK